MKPILHHVLEGPVKSLFGGSSTKQKTSSDPKDMTPGEFVGMRPEIVQQLQNLFSSGGGATFQGPMAAPVTGNEQGLLAQIMQMTSQPSSTAQAGSSFLESLISGGQQVPGMTPLQVDPSAIQGGVPTGEMNPFLDQAIRAAQRPLIEQYQEQIAPALRADFTMAGQQIAGQGSSPFHMAAAREQAGMANALGDIGTEMAFQDFAQRQLLASQEFQQLRDLMVGQELTGRGQDIQGGLASRQQQLDAVSTAAGVERSQLENVLAGLEAQALPRLVEQLGIDRGLEEFRRREEQLLQAIQMAGQLSSPTVANVTRGSSRSSENPDLSQAIGAGIGAFAAASSRAYKDDIQPVDEAMLAEAIRQVPLSSFVYKPWMGIPGKFVGPIAEDTPDVFQGPDNTTVNLYNMVAGLVAASREKDLQIGTLEARLKAMEDRIDGYQ